jgi:DNA adenine methylase
MKPFLKWAGGKFRLVERIRSLLPPGTRLIEPFVGSGAVFLNTDYPRALLADANPDLITLYQILQRDGEGFIAACRALFTPEANTRAVYDERRACFNATQDSWQRAALFVYLNKHCYNGLCRYNSAGEFNVPFGRYQRVSFPQAEMEEFWRRAQGAEFLCAPFAAVMAQAQPGDVVYCDPPYVPLSATAHFTAYSKDGFGAAEQAALAAAAEALAVRGVPVLLSNHDTSLTRRLYANASRLEAFAVRRHISCQGDARGHAAELLALYLPEEVRHVDSP